MRDPKLIVANIIAEQVIKPDTKQYEALIDQVTEENLREARKLPNSQKSSKQAQRLAWGAGFIYQSVPYVSNVGINAKILGSLRAMLPTLLPEVREKFPQLEEDLASYASLISMTKRRVLWVLSHCKTDQDYRDALPEATIRILKRQEEHGQIAYVSDILKHARTRPALWNHADNPNSTTEAAEVIEFMEAQSVVHLLTN